MDFLSKHVAEIIALCALLFTAWQAYIQRKHNKISVKPNLVTYTNRKMDTKTGVLQVFLINNGLGPAFIKKFQILLNGKEYEPEKAIKSVLGSLVDNSSYTVLGIGYAMSEKSEEVLLSVEFPATSWDEVKVVEKKLDELDLLISYLSAYGEKFKLSTQTIVK